MTNVTDKTCPRCRLLQAGKDKTPAEWRFNRKHRFTHDKNPSLCTRCITELAFKEGRERRQRKEIA